MKALDLLLTFGIHLFIHVISPGAGCSNPIYFKSLEYQTTL